MARPLIPPKGVFVPSSLIFDLTLLAPIRDTAVQLMALAWGQRETPPISFEELSELTKKSVPTLYVHMGVLRDSGRLAWRSAGTSTIIVTLLDGMYCPNDYSTQEMLNPLNSPNIKSTKTRIKNSDSSTQENSSPSEPAPRPRDPMFDAIVTVTQIDPTIKSAAASVGKARRELLQAKPPYTADEVLAFGVWWNGDDWRRKNGPPACHNITQKIGVIRNGHSAPSVPTVSIAERAIQISQARRAGNNGK